MRPNRQQASPHRIITILNAVEYLWALACRRLGCKAAPLHNPQNVPKLCIISSREILPMARLPTAINLHKASKTLTLTYAPGEVYHLPAELLRVHSPSAEVQGHGNPILQFGKINVGLVGLEPAGQYALKLTFDDGHDSGLFTWEYLEQLCLRQEQLWAEYLDELHKAGKSRDPAESVVKLML
ncbi:1-(5-phosphoribosyl)-5-[(5-phosphoribosylamino) methylideneamino] imidazole-4-carboxamide isomerase [Pseudomonas putida]|uniref:1-(5-phosphoribosyl)-5-[(5-phosphoribosylamino) methylideneamino] imidazole-4-carboxamide isomerase n=4 Tax=Pseudomonas TaxID=286 RepID=A0A1L7NKT3_PSEPU|nr:1-(5-phosphoribosyl)-5-[(5-phosphoribosylamino) methylideneamino] imidazole-4-carboxamide isomerase [Pseudomonas putida]GLO18166.1 hypothetical protein PPUJ20188_15600 [Pseudomonas putida]